jgi:hypothetical protein
MIYIRENIGIMMNMTMNGLISEEEFDKSEE